MPSISTDSIIRSSTVTTRTIRALCDRLHSIWIPRMGTVFSSPSLSPSLFSTSFVYWIDLGGGQVPMKIGRVRFDGKLADNVITENLLQPNYLVYNLDLHCIFWSDIGVQRVRSFASFRLYTPELVFWLDFLPLHGFRGYESARCERLPSSRIRLSDASIAANISSIDRQRRKRWYYQCTLLLVLRWQRNGRCVQEMVRSQFESDRRDHSRANKSKPTNADPCLSTLWRWNLSLSPIPLTEIEFVIFFAALSAYCFYGSYCEQLCFQIDALNRNAPTCDCAIGFKLNSDGRTCSPRSQQFIVYSTHSLLRAFDHRSNESAREDVMPLISGEFSSPCRNSSWNNDSVNLGNNMEMISVRYAARELYYINANRLIRRAIWTDNRAWNITNYLRISVGAEQNMILGLTLDWVAGNLYFSYISNTYGHLEVNRLGTDHRLILRKGKNETIYAIAVNPKRR